MSSEKKNTESTTEYQRQVKCPQCGRLALYAPENAFRPFCSERCRLIDLGQWADQSYKIPVQVENSNILDDAGDTETED